MLDNAFREAVFQQKFIQGCFVVYKAKPCRIDEDGFFFNGRSSIMLESQLTRFLVVVVVWFSDLFKMLLIALKSADLLATLLEISKANNNNTNRNFITSDFLKDPTRTCQGIPV